MEFCFNEEIGSFNFLMSKIDVVYHEVALRLGITDSSMLILYALCSNNGECMLGDIISGVSKQTINSALRKLEADKIIYLETFNGRKKKVYLTEKGKEFVKDTVLRVIKVENDIFSSWSDEERKIYIGLTQRYLRDFKKKVKEF